MPDSLADGPPGAGPITPVILSGGAGTRLWPLSRPARPKQLLALTGEQSLLQMTAARIAGDARFAAPLVVANAAQADLVEDQLAAVGARPSALILEPCGRNTAAAIALAALACPPETLLLVMPSDHVIQRPDAFLTAVAAGAAAAAEDWLVTFGIRPEHPETGYGYIRRGDPIAPAVFRADGFVEKPDAATAAVYLAAGTYDWNGGIFLFRAAAFLRALGAHAPDILASVEAALAGAQRDGSRVSPDAALFAGTRSQSIDHAVMEHAERIAVVPVDMSWSDVGSWDALYELGAKDVSNNHSSGDVLSIDTGNCLLRGEGTMLVTVGVQDLIVVATPDAVIVMPRGQSQRVKEAVDALARRGDADRT